jgi:betaine-aldehyde dehydrogenase
MTHTIQLAAHWIGGRWVDAGQHRDSINPATGEVIGQYAAAGVAEAQAAIDAALSTFRNTVWKEDRLLRGRVLNKMASEFEGRTEDLVQVLATENGKTLP